MKDNLPFKLSSKSKKAFVSLIECVEVDKWDVVSDNEIIVRFRNGKE